MKFGKSQRPGLAKNTISPGPGQRKDSRKIDDILSPSFDESLYDKPYSSKIGSGKRDQLQHRGLGMPGPGSYQVFS